jgi:hypothetical protein
MSADVSRHDREVQFIRKVLRAPLPPARPAADPAALWACGRHARRIGAEAKISLVVTAAHVGALVGVLGVLVSFVDWRGFWTASTDVVKADPLTGIYVAIALMAIGAAGLVRWSSSRSSS